MHMVVCTSLYIYTHTHEYICILIYIVCERGVDLIEPLIRVAVVYLSKL